MQSLAFPQSTPVLPRWSQRGSEDIAAIWCEILPISLADGQIVYLRRCRDEGRAWHEPQSAGQHPSVAVRGHVEQFFGARIEPRSAVVHSTAWRYEQGRLILTYLAVVDAHWLQQLPTQRAWFAEAVGSEATLRSSSLAPPERIAIGHVLAHALDHLTLLYSTDAAISSVLGGRWADPLASRAMRPAGELPHTDQHHR